MFPQHTPDAGREWQEFWETVDCILSDSQQPTSCTQFINFCWKSAVRQLPAWRRHVWTQTHAHAHTHTHQRTCHYLIRKFFWLIIHFCLEVYLVSISVYVSVPCSVLSSVSLTLLFFFFLFLFSSKAQRTWVKWCFCLQGSFLLSIKVFTPIQKRRSSILTLSLLGFFFSPLHLPLFSTEKRQRQRGVRARRRKGLQEIQRNDFFFFFFPFPVAFLARL